MPAISPTVLETSVWPVPVDLFPFNEVGSTMDCTPYVYNVLSSPDIAPYLSVVQSSMFAIQAEVTDLA